MTDMQHLQQAQLFQQQHQQAIVGSIDCLQLNDVSLFRKNLKYF